MVQFFKLMTGQTGILGAQSDSYVLYAIDTKPPKTRRPKTRKQYNIALKKKLQFVDEQQVLFEILEGLTQSKVSSHGNLFEITYLLKGLTVEILAVDEMIAVQSKLGLQNIALKINQQLITDKEIKVLESSHRVIFLLSDSAEEENANKRIDEGLQKVKTWIEKAPHVSHSMVLKELWNHVWGLQLVDSPALTKIPQTIDPCELLTTLKWDDYSFTEIIAILDDLMWYRADLVQQALDRCLTFFEPKTGFCPNFSGELNQTNRAHQISQLPVWSYFILEFAKFIQDPSLLLKWYPVLSQNMEWWEKHRYNLDYELFEIKGTVQEICAELGHPNSPRVCVDFENDFALYPKSTERTLLPIDLNNQMMDYYQNLGVIANLTGELEEGARFFGKAEDLQHKVQKTLWDAPTQFFYDYDLDKKQRSPHKDFAAFWTFFGGAGNKNQVNELHRQMTDKKNFWAEFPIASFSLNSPLIEAGVSLPRVVISQNLWFLIGLRRYNFNETLTRCVVESLKYLNDSYNLYHRIYQYYPAQSLNLNAFKRTKLDRVPKENKLGFCPIHSFIYRGLLGAEILDNSINFVPAWGELDSLVKFSVYYKNKEEKCLLDELTKKFISLS